jgi:hypothetical protein
MSTADDDDDDAAKKLTLDEGVDPTTDLTRSSPSSPVLLLHPAGPSSDGVLFADTAGISGGESGSDQNLAGVDRHGPDTNGYDSEYRARHTPDARTHIISGSTPGQDRPRCRLRYWYPLYVRCEGRCEEGLRHRMVVDRSALGSAFM